MSEKKFYITSEEDCGRCEKSGVAYNRAWDAFDFEHGDGRQFQREHGPEELECGACGGEGRIVRRVELGEALSSPEFQQTLRDVLSSVGVDTNTYA
jgi:DnaJ-class molecular chaperone